MEEIKTKGIVLKSVDFKDSDRIVTIFSIDYGLMTFVAKGVKKPKAKLVFAVQPFCFSEFQVIKGKGISTLIGAVSIDQFFDITTDFDKYILCLASLEICLKTVKQNSPEKELFFELLNSLNAVCYGGVNPMVAFIKFTMRSVKILGYTFELSKCACCGRDLSKNFENKFFAFSYDYSGMICGGCSNSYDYLKLSNSEFETLKTIFEKSYDELGSSSLPFNFTRDDLVSLVTLVSRDFRFLTDEEIETLKQFL